MDTPSVLPSDKPLSPGLIGMLLVTAAGMMVVPFLILNAPTEPTMGFVQRIFYFHVPCAWLAMLGAFTAGIASAVFLAGGRRAERAEQLAAAAAELAVVFGICVIVTGPLWARWCEGQRNVDRDDLLAFFDQAAEDQPQIARWTEPTRKRLAGDILSCLRDLGLLEGTQRKRIIRPQLPLSTAEHLLRVLVAEGKRGAEILTEPTWRIFLCTPGDVADVLTRLSHTRRIGFERSGSHVVLHIPEAWETAA